jgi:hypothetical protein
MEREGVQDRHHGGERRRNTEIDELGTDDQEFASVEDTGPEPSENLPVDDV